MQRITGLPDEQVLAYEVRIEAAMRAALADVMDTIARRIEASMPILASVLVAADGDEVLPPPPGQPYVSPDDLASIPPLWQQAVVDQILPIAAQVFLDAAMRTHANMVEASSIATLPSVGSLASERYLAQAQNTFDQVGDHLWATARSELVEGFEAGESIPQLAERLRASAGVTARTGVLVARTQVIEASNAGSFEVAQASDLALIKEYMATPDLRTRPTHLAADGQRVPIKEPFIIGGFPAMFPAASTLPPAERLNCRCSLGYLLPDRAIAQMKENLTQLQAQEDLPGTEGPLTQIFPKEEAPGLDLPARGTNPPGYVRPSLRDAKTPRQLRRVWQDEVEGITGFPFVVDAMPRGISMVTAREYAEGTLQMFAQFPGAKVDRVHWFDDPASSSYAQVRRGGNALEFNTRYASETGRPKFLAARRKDVAGYENGGTTSWGVRNDVGGQGVVYHEFTHILDIENGREAVHGQIVPLLIRHAQTEGITDIDDLVKRRISSYATKNYQEMVAEAGTDVMVNGAAASRLSRDIFDLVRAEYRRRGFEIRTAPVDEIADEAGEVFPTGTGREARAARLRELDGETPADVKRFDEGEASDAEILTFVDGSQAIRKTFAGRLRSIDDEIAAEDLGAQVLGAFELRTPVVVRSAARADSVVMEVVEGRTGQSLGIDKYYDDLSPADFARYVDTPSGHRVGIADYIMGNEDRNSGNWLIADDGSLGGIDHAFAFRFNADTLDSDNPFLRFLAGINEYPRPLASAINFSRTDLVPIRSRLEALRPEFERLGKADWHDQMMTRLAAVEDRASGPGIVGEAFPKAAAPKPLAKMTVVELRAEAKARGLSVPAGTRKADLVRMIDDAPPAPSGERALRAAPLDVQDEAGFRRIAPTEAGDQFGPFEAVRRYRGVEFREINDELLAGGTAEGNPLIRGIDAAMDASPLRSAVQTYRGLSERGFVRESGLAMDGDLTGATWVDRAYASTGVDEMIGRGFANKRDGIGVFMRVVTPEGTKAIAISGGEAELLLQRGLTFRVVADRGVEQFGRFRHRVLDVEVVPAKATPLPEPPPLSRAPLAIQRRQDELRAAAARPVLADKSRRQSGQNAYTTQVEHEGGPPTITKDFSRLGEGPAASKRRADAEELGALVSEASGIRAPAVIRTGPQSVEMELIEGTSGEDYAAWPRRTRDGLTKTDDGRLLGLADVLMGNADRNAGNFIRATDGHLVAIDHEGAFGSSKLVGATDQFGGDLIGRDVFMPATKWPKVIDINPADLAVIRARLEALRPEFERLGRATWHRQVMARLVEVEKRADPNAAIRLAEARPDLATIRKAARTQAATIATQRGNAALIARIDELVQAKASKAVIRQELDPALRQAEQLYAGASDDVADALRAAVDSGDAAKIRAALTRQSKANGLTPIGKAGAKAKFDPATMEGVGGTAIPDGADVIVVRRGAKLAGIDTPEKAVVRPDRPVVKPRPVGSSKATIKANGDIERSARSGVVEGSEVDPGQGVSAITRRVQFEDGSYGWSKVAHGEESLDDEYLDNLVLQAAGAPAPGVYRASANTLFMEDIEGAIGRDLTQAQQESALGSADGRLIGLGDAIMGNGDRHVFSANYIRTQGGRIVPIDNAPALVLRSGSDTFEFREPRDFQGRPLPAQDQEGNDFLERWVDRGSEGYGVRLRVGSEFQDENLRDFDGALVDVWRPGNDLTAVEHKAIRARLEALRPEFERLGRGARLDYIQGRLDAIYEVSAARLPVSSAATVAKGDFAGLTRVGEQLGGNPGGIFEAGDGSRWYVKAAVGDQQARSEALALDLYRATGLDAPEIVIGQGVAGLGQRQVATRFLDDAQVDLRARLASDPAYIADVQDGFAVDAWLANWDVVGANPAPGKGWDNIVSVAGRPVRIEAGGALRFRGLGGTKPFGETVTELDTLRDPATARRAAELFKDMTPQQIIASAERVRKVTPAKIKALVKRNGLDPELADTLIARRADILQRAEAMAGPKPMTIREYNAAIKAAAKKREALDAAQIGRRYIPARNPGDFGDTEWRGWDDTDARDAFDGYTGNDFDLVNSTLRGVTEFDPSTPGGRLGRDIITGMDRGFDHSRLTQDVELWRSPGSGRGIFGDPATWGDDLAGFEWRDDAYSSASADKRVADNFVKDGGVRLRILAPKGSKAVQLSDLSGPFDAGAEAEILLARGARYRVARDRGWTEIANPNGFPARIRVRDLDVEVVVPDETPPLPWATK